MANFNFLKLIIAIMLFVQIPIFAQNNSPSSHQNYEEIYENLQEADFEYMFGIDPYQADEYTKYMHSPYPLFRTGVSLIFKSKKIPPGYYLLTPREKEGKTWILFKENGRVSFVIPVYDEQIVNKEFYEKNIPHEIPTKTQKVRQKTLDFIGKKWGKQNQRTPIPQTYVEFSDEGMYWNMVLYYGDKKYYLLFLKEE